MKKIFILISQLLEKKNLYITKSLSYKSNCDLLDPNLDFVRYKTLELCVNEIIQGKIDGAIAEVGVYRGNFAEKLNKLFPNRKLYLFDTFEGFDERDVKIERTHNFSEGSQNFQNTSVDLVLSKMQSPDQCIVKKGFFPETASDVEDKFCFVSLDADLFQPIYDGLDYFYPKLNKGGYIFIHDFNNEEYQGAREAVLKYCQEKNIGFLPIPDNGGTAIIVK